MFGRSDPFDEMFDISPNFDALFRRTLGELVGLTSEETEGKKLLPASSTRSVVPAGATWPAFTAGTWYPPVECFARDNEFVLRAELPGVDPKDVEVSLASNRLVLRGHKQEQHQGKQGSLYFREISHGQFERAFTLPEGVKTDGVKASFSNGVLEVTLPAEGVGRKVPIEVAGGERKAIKAA